MSKITTGMATQYSDSSKLAARARLLREFTTADVGWFTWVAQQLPLSQGADVLDVGCGPAWFWPEAAAVLPSDIALTLVDQSAGMVEEALVRTGPLGFRKLDGIAADAASLPFPDRSFDAVIAMQMLYHVADQQRAIAESTAFSGPVGRCLSQATARKTCANSIG